MILQVIFEIFYLKINLLKIKMKFIGKNWNLLEKIEIF